MKYNKEIGKIIGLTGGIATGKSTVSKILREEGYQVIDADLIARDIVKPGKPAYKELVAYYGENILNPDKTINRPVLGQLVFSNKDLVKKLNQITHPYIFQEIKKEIEESRKKENIIFLDIPLLFEEKDKLNKHNIKLDEIWLVYVDEDLQLERLVKRNKLEKKEASERISLQIPIEEKKKMATRVIDNSKDIDFLREEIREKLSQL